MDPFDSPASESRPPNTGTLDLGQAVSEGVGAVFANLFQIFAVGILGVLAYYASCCTLVGWVVILPLLMWGAYAFMLQALDGKAEVRTLWSGTAHLQHAFVHMWGFTLMMMVLYIPVTVVAVGLMWPDLQAAFSGQPIDPVMQTVKIMVPVFFWGFLLVRFMLAPCLIVERRMTSVDALQMSWDATQGQWLKLCALQVLLYVLNVPGQVLSVGSQVYAQQFQNDPAATLEALPITMSLSLLGMLVAMVAGVFGMMFYTSAYRQLTGPAPIEGSELV